jgi:hypothetical protein
MPTRQIEGIHDSSFELLELIDYISGGEDQDITPGNRYQSAGDHPPRQDGQLLDAKSPT